MMIDDDEVFGPTCTCGDEQFVMMKSLYGYTYSRDGRAMLAFDHAYLHHRTAVTITLEV
jgi:hypothetical protein